VAEIDSVGTVSQGVVTYNVKMSFDTQDDRVKPGMSVSAAIITDIKQDILVVPNSAVKSQSGMSYVEMFDMPLPAPVDGLIGSISKIAPNKIPVEVGLANDSDTEITSGIKEGDEIVTRTILPSASTKTATAAPSLFGSAGGNRGTTGGGGIRTPGR
jgi:multidrug efflux pump subunit AcrA (membrane-fusion protein)